MKQNLKFWLLLGALAGTLVFSGCVAASDKSVTNVPTTGQELIDLKNAYEQGALSETEYESQKEKILSRSR